MIVVLFFLATAAWTALELDSLCEGESGDKRDSLLEHFYCLVWFGLVWGLSNKLFVLVFNEVRFAIA